MILLDADVLVYWSAFAAQKTSYDCMVQSITEHPLQGVRKLFPNAKDRDAWMKENNLTKAQVHSEPVVDVMPEAMALKLASQRWDDVVAAAGGGKVEAYLTGTGNYRDKYAVTKPYKGNRAQEKPIHYEAVRSYFAGRSEIVSGMEADDAIGVRSTQLAGAAIIASIDKDMNMLPGRHYDWGKGIRFTISEDDAQLFFMAQVIAGDSTDNIQGIPGWGLKGALKELRRVNSRSNRWAVVRAAYDDAAKPADKKTPALLPMGADTTLTEMGILVWIQRHPDQLWSITDYEEGYINGH